MSEKGKKGKVGRTPKPAAPPAPEHLTQEEPEEEQKPVQSKSVQPQNEVSPRKGCHRYRWEIKDSNKEFWLMGHAEVKILILGCLTAAMIMFTGTAVHPILTLIITMEMSIFCFFFIVHTLAVQRYMPFILWPVADLLNDLFSTIFLTGASVFAVKSRKTMPMNYFIAVVLIGMAGLFAVIDMCLQRNHFRGKKAKKNVLVPPEKQQPEKEEEAVKPKEAKPKAGVKEKPSAPKPKDAGKPKEKKEGKK